jgi:hypothetical protein
LKNVLIFEKKGGADTFLKNKPPFICKGTVHISRIRHALTQAVVELPVLPSRPLMMLAVIAAWMLVAAASIASLRRADAVTGGGCSAPSLRKFPYCDPSNSADQVIYPWCNPAAA